MPSPRQWRRALPAIRNPIQRNMIERLYINHERMEDVYRDIMNTQGVSIDVAKRHHRYGLLAARRTFAIKESQRRKLTARGNYYQDLMEKKRITQVILNSPRRFNSDALRRHVSEPDTSVFWDRHRTPQGGWKKRKISLGSQNKNLLNLRIRIIDHLLAIPSGTATFSELSQSLREHIRNRPTLTFALSQLIDLGAIERTSPRTFFITPYWELKEEAKN